MSQAKDLKEQVVTDIKEKISKSKGVVIVDYKGLTVAQDTELRAKFRKADVEYRVLKNTLVKRALNELGYSQFDADLNGPTAVAFSYGDEVSAAKVFCESAEQYKKMAPKSGLVDGMYLDAAGVKSLATIPSREALIGGLACALLGTVRKLAVGLKAVADKQAEAQA